MAALRARTASSPREMGLERKLAAYAVASGAFLAVSASGQAQAEVYWSGPEDITIPTGSLNAPGTYIMDVTSTGPLSGTPVYFEFANYFGVGPFLGVYDGTIADPVSTSQVVIDPSSFESGAAALSAGTLVSSSSVFDGGGNGVFMGKMKGGSPKKGDWAGAQYMFLGLSFVVGDPTYYGWAELSFPDSSGTAATLLGWAYESDPGVGILTGPGVSAVPEPSTLALSLLALGSLGVAALHRARRAKVEATSAA